MEEILRSASASFHDAIRASRDHDHGTGIINRDGDPLYARYTTALRRPTSVPRASGSVRRTAVTGAVRALHRLAPDDPARRSSPAHLDSIK